MIGFTKEQIVAKANEWIVTNQAWSDNEVRKAISGCSNQFEALEAATLTNLRVVLPQAIATIIAAQNELITKQIEEMIDKKINK